MSQLHTRQLLTLGTGRIPPIAKVNLLGALPAGVTGKDVIVLLCALFKNDVLNHAIEFAGPGVETLPIETRFPISNMSTEWGALSGVSLRPFLPLACIWGSTYMPEGYSSRYLVPTHGLQCMGHS